jgi:hypothetical protein
LEVELQRLVDAVAEGAGEIPALARAMCERQAELEGVRERLAAHRAGEQPADAIARRLGREIRERLDELATLLQRQAPEARRAIEKVFPEGLRATPFIDTAGARRWMIEGDAVFGAGSSAMRKGASPAGFEPAYPA